MKNFRFLFIILIMVLINNPTHTQEEDFYGESNDSLEIYLIDNYIKSETEKILILSWMTNIPVKSKVEIKDIGIYPVSDTLTDFHQVKIDLNNFKFDKEENYFRIISEFEDGKIIESDDYSFLVPVDSSLQFGSQSITTSSSYYLYNFLTGITLWLLPSPGLAIENNQTKFALVKDLPIISIGSSSAYKTFPYAYFYSGYSHIFNGDIKNAFRIGTKYLYEIKDLKHFISFGIGGFTNFKGSNGLSSEIGFSFLKVLNTFEMYGSYSYNYLLSTKRKFHLFNIGLFTSSFSINLNY